ncbi:alkaline phosphatase family protein [Candidatus Bathyarchaeota archaeon]|nr:alkaline phosphatase family protein [Candidatus Bathyarchaeota archaeon]
MRPIVLLVLDGITWDYIEAANTPFLDSLMRMGSAETCRAMVPTVTNVNNASIITGAFPEEHGISSNSYYDPKTGLEVFMDSSSFLTHPTFLELEAKGGGRTLLLTVKDKLLRLLSRGATASYSAERPPGRLVEEIGMPPSIYSSEVSTWLLKAARLEMERRRWDLAYISTTDYIPHKYPPSSQEAREYLSNLDEELGRLFELDVVLGIVADHGMNQKRVNLDPVRLLKEDGIEARMVAAIRDEHPTHHMNLGGSAYLYLEEGLERAREALASAEGVEEVLSRDEAARRFRLPAERIGDLLLLADFEYTLGLNSRSIYEDVEIRSHGSLHEAEVPLISSLRMETEGEAYNKDLFPRLKAAIRRPG